MSSTDMPTEARGFPVRSVLLRHGDRGAALVEAMLDQSPSATVLLMTGAPTLDHLPSRVARCLLRKPFSLDEAVRTILRAREGEST